MQEKVIFDAYIYIGIFNKELYTREINWFNNLKIMGNVQAVIDLPEELYLSLSASGLTKERIASESRKLLALKCFREKVLSLGRAAQLAGLSKLNFTEYLSENDVAVIDYDQDEITREFDTAERLTEKLKT